MLRSLLFVLLVLTQAAAAGAQGRGAAPPPPADLNEPPADAQKSSTGLISRMLKPGNSEEKPEATDVITVHYTGWSSDGRMFDSSVVRGTPGMFPIARV